MNNDTKKQLKKWGKPVIDVQWFLPQEYCGSCWAEITGLSSASRLYVDMVNIGTYQSYEKFNSGYSAGAAVNRNYTGVNIYYLYNITKSRIETSNITISNNQSYTSNFTASNGYTYRFDLVGQYDVKVNENHRALYKAHEVS